MELSVVIPAYNEEKRIGRTLRAINDYLPKNFQTYEILVVDDGSKDETIATVNKLNIPHTTVLSYGVNRGKGFAVNYGARHAQGDWILMTDADNSTPIEEIKKLEVFTDKYSVIIGSRYAPGGTMVIKQDIKRIILSRLGNMITRLILLPNIFDTQCGFKMFSAQAANVIFPKQTIWRWGFDMEILKIARDNKIRIKEVPITWYNDEGSRIQSTSVFWKTFLELLNIKINSLLGRYRS